MVRLFSRHRLAAALAGLVLLFCALCQGAEYSASFKNVDIQEFINTVSKNLNKTIIMDPAVKGTISVRSWETMNEEQYYQFFLSVLDVYGFAVIAMDNHVLKVIRAKDAKTSATPVASDDHPGVGDEVITRVVSLRNVAARDLAPLLRQLNDNAGSGSVVHYESSNVILMTGRAAVIQRLMAIIAQVDKSGDRSIVRVPLENASAKEVVGIIGELNKADTKSALPELMTADAVADERTNSVIVRGEPVSRDRLVAMVRELDKHQDIQNNTQVIYLKYAKAADLVEVLTGVSDTLSAEQKNSKPAQALTGDMVIKAHEQTNALIINAPTDVMRDLKAVIAQLDIRRPQVLVEAVIAEVMDSDGANLGVQWANKNGGGTQFTNTGLPLGSMAGAAMQYNDDGTISSDASAMLGGFNGMATGFYHGNWAALFTALSSNSQNDILATPSIVTLDNMEATFNVGQEVPVLSGSQTTSGDNIFNTVERKTVGIKLKVKPQINEGDSVMLEIEQEVSSVADAASSSSADLGATFNTRTVNNAVLVRSGETVVVGGLLDSNVTESEDKVPLLGDIPVLGALFRSTSKQHSKRNLMLFIRPLIIRDSSAYRAASASKYDSFNGDTASQRKGGEGEQLLQKAIPSLSANGSSNATFLQVQRDILRLYPAKEQ